MLFQKLCVIGKKQICARRCGTREMHCVWRTQAEICAKTPERVYRPVIERDKRETHVRNRASESLGL